VTTAMLLQMQAWACAQGLCPPTLNQGTEP
jgi:hypothetical protein